MLEKRIPTIIALVIIIAGIFGAVSLSGKQTKTDTKASATIEAREITISNVSDTSLTISWLTDGEFPQYVVVLESTKKNFCQPEYGSSSGPCYYDDRDLETHTPSKHKTHHVTIDGLTPNSKYSIKIYTSGILDGKIIKDVDGKPISTASTISGAASSAVVYGNLYYSDGKTPASDALIYLNIDKGAKISTLSKLSGSWLLTLNKLRNSSVDSYLNPGNNDPFNIEVKIDANLKTNIKTVLGASQPLPDVILTPNGNLDFSTNLPDSVSSGVASSPSPGKKSGFNLPTPLNNAENGIPLTIISPSQNSSSDDLPTFRGTADPGQVVTIEVNSETPITATVRTDVNGNWFWTPPSNLAPGEHTVTITIIDSNGNEQRQTRNFTVLPGENTLPITAGSESGSLKSPTPSPILTPVPTIEPEPTYENLPMPIQTLLPTPLPTIASGKQEIPTTASFWPFIISLTSGVVFATIGLWLFFNRRSYY